ncbi:hypothetical protein D3C84_164760 [compost metagenome]
MILRPGLQPTLQPGQRRHRALRFSLDHFRVQRKAVQHLGAGQPLQGHLAAIGPYGQHVAGVTLDQRGQQTQAIGQPPFTVFVQARPQVIRGNAQILAALAEQFLSQLNHLVDIRTGELVDLFTHALEIIVVTRILADSRLRADGLQPGLPVLRLGAGKGQRVAFAQAAGDQFEQAHG